MKIESKQLMKEEVKCYIEEDNRQVYKDGDRDRK